MMKSISILPLLAIIISPAISQPHNAVEGDTPASASVNPRSNPVPQACHDTNAIVYEQLQEISRLQAQDLPTSHDGAGYIYAVFSGRRMLGCPNEKLVSANGNDTSASQEIKRSAETTNPLLNNASFGDPCEVVRLLKAQVDDQMNVMKAYNIPAPDFVAGLYSGTQDLDDGLKCGLVHNSEGSSQRNSTVSPEE